MEEFWCLIKKIDILQYSLIFFFREFPSNNFHYKFRILDQINTECSETSTNQTNTKCNP